MQQTAYRTQPFARTKKALKTAVVASVFLLASFMPLKETIAKDRPAPRTAPIEQIVKTKAVDENPVQTGSTTRFELLMNNEKLDTIPESQLYARIINSDNIHLYRRLEFGYSSSPFVPLSSLYFDRSSSSIGSCPITLRSSESFVLDGELVTVQLPQLRAGKIYTDNEGRIHEKFFAHFMDDHYIPMEIGKMIVYLLSIGGVIVFLRYLQYRYIDDWSVPIPKTPSSPSSSSGSVINPASPTPYRYSPAEAIVAGWTMKGGDPRG